MEAKHIVSDGTKTVVRLGQPQWGLTKTGLSEKEHQQPNRF